jgi:hypothetical protein
MPALFGSESFLLFLPENIKIGVHRTIILPFAFYGCKTWFITSRREHRLQIFEGAERIFQLTRKESGKNFMMKRLMICVFHQILWRL